MKNSKNAFKEPDLSDLVDLCIETGSLSDLVAVADEFGYKLEAREVANCMTKAKALRGKSLPGQFNELIGFTLSEQTAKPLIEGLILSDESDKAMDFVDRFGTRDITALMFVEAPSEDLVLSRLLGATEKFPEFAESLVGFAIMWGQPGIAARAAGLAGRKLTAIEGEKLISKALQLGTIDDVVDAAKTAGRKLTAAEKQQLIKDQIDDNAPIDGIIAARKTDVKLSGYHLRHCLEEMRVREKVLSKPA